MSIVLEAEAATEIGVDAMYGGASTVSFLWASASG